MPLYTWDKAVLQNKNAVGSTTVTRVEACSDSILETDYITLIRFISSLKEENTIHTFYVAIILSCLIFICNILEIH